MKIKDLIYEQPAMQQIGSIAKDVGSVGSMMAKDFAANKKQAYNTVKSFGTGAAKQDYKLPLEKAIAGQSLTSKEVQSLQSLQTDLIKNQKELKSISNKDAANQLTAVIKSQPANIDSLKAILAEI